MSSTLEADRDAREVFNLAAIAVGMGDKDAALDVCKKLQKIEPHYRLALRTEPTAEFPQSRTGQAGKPGPGRLISSQYAGRCRTCGAGHTVGASVYYTPGVKGVECRQCGGKP